jgi:steroid 5-alpha reductase family enzyme
VERVVPPNDPVSTVEWSLLAPAAALCALVMLAVWAVQARRRDATPVDIAWAANLGALALLYAFLAEGEPARRALVGLLGGLWSARLAGWLAWHRLGRGRPEDARYAALRASWGPRANRNFFWFFQAQGLLDVLLSLPFLLAASNAAHDFGPLEILGAIVAAGSICGETLADVQLDRFKKDPANRGRTCRAGLWRLSRHPNYFFEFTYWIGVALLAWSAPFGWIGVLAPALMLYLLWNVTGIPAAEAQAVRSRGADYLDYQRRTSAFVPWFPREPR